MKLLKNLPLLITLFSLFTLPAISHAQQATESRWEEEKDRIHEIIDDGQTSVLVSGYAHHGRGTYTAERLKELNERAWGLGYAKTLRNEKDNEEIVYAFGIEDSHYKPQLMAGYAYQWVAPLGGNWEAAGGFTAMMVSRQDYFHGTPFPVVLPLVSVGTRSTKLMASYVPRLSKNKGNGDVLLLFMRFDIK
ncbi:hypothetical protein [Undibacterium terreum]|nr:hypothetical protein [Undibacterium terreum]